MKEVDSMLLSWAEQYFKSRDAFYKKIKAMKKQDDLLIIEYAQKEEKIKACADLVFDKSKEDVIITLNSKKNLNTLHDQFSDFATSPSKLFFINPFSLLEKRWIITPSIHAKICDESSLKLGLQSMFETVDPISEDVFVAQWHKADKDVGAQN